MEQQDVVITDNGDNTYTAKITGLEREQAIIAAILVQRPGGYHVAYNAIIVNGILFSSPSLFIPIVYFYLNYYIFYIIYYLIIILSLLFNR